MFDERLNQIVAEQPFPLVFAALSGAHLYGFPSPDSDYDVRGVHILPVHEVIGLNDLRETIEVEKIENSLELDLVTHDAKKFFSLMLKKNGYVLEQLYSPLVLKTSQWHEELKEIGKNCITRHHAHHYFGFAATEWKLFQKENPPRVKPLLYIYRVLLTGIYLMQTGEIEANLVTLNEHVFKIAYLPELIRRKIEGAEKGTLEKSDIDFYRMEYEKLRDKLQTEFENSRLPEVPTGKNALNDLLVRLRFAEG
jgi:uncharacterized protein